MWKFVGASEVSVLYIYIYREREREREIKLNGEDKKGSRRPNPMSFKGFLKAQF